MKDRCVLIGDLNAIHQLVMREDVVDVCRSGAGRFEVAWTASNTDTSLTTRMEPLAGVS